MNLSGVAQKNFSYYNKDSIDLNRFFEKMTFQDLYNDFAEENTPSYSASTLSCSNTSPFLLPNNNNSSNSNNNLINQQGVNSSSSCCSSSTVTPTQNNSNSSSSMLPLQEYSNNYQNMNQRHKVSLQSKSSFCSQTSTASSSMSFSTASSGFAQNPFSNITNIKNNNQGINQGNIPSHLNTNQQQQQLQQQQIKQQQQQLQQQIPLYHKQNSLKLEKKVSKKLKLKNAIDEFFFSPLETKFQQKIAFPTSCNAQKSQQINFLACAGQTQFYPEPAAAANTYDLFSQSNGISCYSLFMTQQNSQNLSDCEINSESVY